MVEKQEKDIEINVQNGGLINIAFDNAHIDAQQNNENVEKNKTGKTVGNKNCHTKIGKIILIIIIIAIIIVGVLFVPIFIQLFPIQNVNNEQSESSIDTVQQDEKNLKDDELYNNPLFLKAQTFLIEGKYLDAAVAYNELYGSLENIQDYQLENIRFWEANAYFSQFLLDGEDKYRYKAIEIFEEVANTRNEENEDIKLLSMGTVLLLGKDLSDVDYEKKMTYYCKVLEEAIVNYNPSNMEDFNTYNTLTICYYALAEYYQKQCKKGDLLEAYDRYLILSVSYYQEALKNCRGMMKYDHGISDSKNLEIILLKELAKYDPVAYLLTKDEKYLVEAELCFAEIEAKVDVNTDLYLYVASMKNVAIGKINIGTKESLEEAYEILKSLFYHICKDDEEICDIGYWMIRTDLATEFDIESVKNCYSRMINELKKEEDIRDYVIMVYNAADCYWYLTCNYQDKKAYEEGYSYLLQLENAYLDIAESYYKDNILELKKSYESYQEY